MTSTSLVTRQQPIQDPAPPLIGCATSPHVALPELCLVLCTLLCFQFLLLRVARSKVHLDLQPAEKSSRYLLLVQETLQHQQLGDTRLRHAQSDCSGQQHKPTNVTYHIHVPCTNMSASWKQAQF